MEYKTQYGRVFVFHQTDRFALNKSRIGVAINDHKNK